MTVATKYKNKYLIFIMAEVAEVDKGKFCGDAD